MRVLLIVAIVAVSWGCQSAPVDYGVIRDKASDGEPVSIAKLSDAFLSLPDLPARMDRLADLEAQALQLVEDEPLKLGSIGTAILDTYYGSLTGHYVLEKFYRHLESEEAETHARWVDRIREHMQNVGDGTREAPFPVVTTIEAQIYVLSLDMPPVGSMYQTSVGPTCSDPPHPRASFTQRGIKIGNHHVVSWLEGFLNDAPVGIQN